MLFQIVGMQFDQTGQQIVAAEILSGGDRGWPGANIGTATLPPAISSLRPMMRALVMTRSALMPQLPDFPTATDVW
jgi:hypothetical protein